MSDDKDNESKVDVLFDMFEDVFERQNIHIKRTIEREITHLKEELKQHDDFTELVEPVIDEKVIKIKAEINDMSGEMVVKAIKKQIKESQPEMIDALYPIIGKLIKKYLEVELERLSENINKQIDNTFSLETFKREFLSLFGIKEKDLILKKAAEPAIEESYLIYQDSGILFGEYSRMTITDHDLIAGMLTAIKSFVKDTFQGDQNLGDLDMIEYGTFKIITKNFQRYYLVAVVSGVVDSYFKMRVQEYLTLFDEKVLANLSNEALQNKDFSDKLKEHWEHFPQFNPLIQKANEFTASIKQKSDFSWKFWRW